MHCHWVLDRPAALRRQHDDDGGDHRLAQRAGAESGRWGHGLTVCTIGDASRRDDGGVTVEQAEHRARHGVLLCVAAQRRQERMLVH
jgi:hypothetical protein